MGTRKHYVFIISEMGVDFILWLMRLWVKRNLSCTAVHRASKAPFIKGQTKWHLQPSQVRSESSKKYLLLLRRLRRVQSNSMVARSWPLLTSQRMCESRNDALVLRILCLHHLNRSLCRTRSFRLCRLHRLVGVSMTAILCAALVWSLARTCTQ